MVDGGAEESGTEKETDDSDAGDKEVEGKALGFTIGMVYWIIGCGERSRL